MQLSNIAQFLEKYKDKLLYEENKQEVIVSVLLKVTGVHIASKFISVERGVLTVHVSPVIKNEIFMHKDKILKDIRDLGRSDIFDIR